MKTAPDHVASIRDRLRNGSDCSGRFLWSATASVCLADVLHGTTLDVRLEELAGRSILIATRDQLAAALALVELDGIARRLVVCTPDVSAEYLPSIIASAEVDVVVSDGHLDQAVREVPLRTRGGVKITPTDDGEVERCATEWVLLTSGTTGAPRMLAHSLAGLTAAITSAHNQETDVVWGTFYDIRRYGGLQILLRALLGHRSLVLSDAAEPPGDFLGRLGAYRATHISGTPSHWRRALMSPSARSTAPRYVRLSGEIADQTILNTLRAFYPHASIGHAFASTEAGVAFEVDDGLEGFPANLIDAPGDVTMRIEDGSLRIRSDRTAIRGLGDDSSALADHDGFVDTGDMVERRGDRYYFLGRRSGVINVGGLKVYPEEVEAVINRHPAVRVSIVRSRRSPITGALVDADVVLKGEPEMSSPSSQIDDFKREILQICRDSLAAHKVPATIRFVPALDVGGAGKLARHRA
jgi:acyl-coenzyme A synthetase/AMP-(fatty) acid ligase